MIFTRKEFDSIYRRYKELYLGLEEAKVPWKKARCPGNFRDWAKIHSPEVCDAVAEMDKLAELAAYLESHKDKAYNAETGEIVDRPPLVTDAERKELRIARATLGGVEEIRFSDAREVTKIRRKLIPGTDEWDFTKRLAIEYEEREVLYFLEKEEAFTRQDYLNYVYGPGTKYNQSHWVPAVFMR